ncbi:hypothetical protein IV500_10975 [Paeniglutamicibacter antarcticus]|uniref:Uncharacterized protein n=1 Tax=Arthrobacter terrae TaxID=2935737 RepID=A0A931CKD2_9MICC|nr:hypothetical protein [Arthrobacter terrae]MBG0739908.1 hypothetical protein [Arthrobacter terrae]
MSVLVIGLVQLLCCAAVAGVSAAVMVYALRMEVHRDGGPRGDALFWHVFLGLAFVLPAVIIPAVVTPLAGAVLLLVTVMVGAWTYRGTPWLDGRRRQRLGRRAELRDFGALATRHDAVLVRWSGYELDPVKMIDYPDLSDVRRAETAALIRTMREAEVLRRGVCEAGGSAADRGRAGSTGMAYAIAVDRLEKRLVDAELAAGVPSTGPVGEAEPEPAAVPRAVVALPRTAPSWAGWGDPGRGLPARNGRAKVEI